VRARAVVVTEATVADALGGVLAADARTGDGRVALRKGTLLRDAQRTTLGDLTGVELHLIDLEPGELGQDDAARRLAHALAGPGTGAEAPEQGQARVRATRRGLLRVRVEVIGALNGMAPLLCFTQPDGSVVLEGDDVAGAKAASLGTPGRVLAEAEALIGSAGPPLEVAPFVARRAFVVATERLERRGREMVVAAVRRKIGWYGSALLEVAEVPHQRAAVAAALRQAVEAGADLLLVSGANALDPLDPALAALADLGGEVLRTGVPAHPGSMVWCGRLGAMPVLGIATCAGFGKNTALDLILPRVLAGADLASAIAAIGHGGLAEGPAAAARFPPYDRG